MYYSKSTGGFYLPEIHREGLPGDAVEISDEVYAELLKGQSDGKRIIPDSSGYPTLIDPPAPSIEQVLLDYESAIEARLDQFAQARGYRHGDRLVSFKGSSVAKWAAEAGRYIELRESTWIKFFQIADDIKASKRPMPTLDELLLELPALTWEANV